MYSPDWREREREIENKEYLLLAKTISLSIYSNWKKEYTFGPIIPELNKSLLRIKESQSSLVRQYCLNRTCLWKKRSNYIETDWIILWSNIIWTVNACEISKTKHQSQMPGKSQKSQNSYPKWCTMKRKISRHEIYEKNRFCLISVKKNNHNTRQGFLSFCFVFLRDKT